MLRRYILYNTDAQLFIIQTTQLRASSLEQPKNHTVIFMPLIFTNGISSTIYNFQTFSNIR